MKPIKGLKGNSWNRIKERKSETTLSKQGNIAGYVKQKRLPK
jgi:hypothetical protein